VTERWPETAIEIDKFSKDRGVIAHVELVSNDLDPPNAMQLKSQMESVNLFTSVSNICMSDCRLRHEARSNPSKWNRRPSKRNNSRTVSIYKTPLSPGIESTSPAVELWTWLALAGAIVLFLLALFCTICLLCRVKSSKRHKMVSFLVLLYLLLLIYRLY
jgi:hypothetical protein